MSTYVRLCYNYLMKKLNLTETERANMFVTFDMNKYVMFCKVPFGFAFMSSYLTKEDFKADMELNGIKPEMDHDATMKYLGL